MKKFCSRCHVERDAEHDFSWKYKQLGIHQSRCKLCQAELGKLHYQKDKEIYKERARIRKSSVLAENQVRLRTYLANQCCVDCGETDIRVFEFDHVLGQKAGEITDLLREGFNWSIIEAEIAKCEICCANCHRKRTCERDGNWWKVKEG